MDKLHLLLLLSGLCSLSSCAFWYKFSQDARTWDEARTYCRENGGDLVTMYTLEQMQTALQAVGGQFGQGVWIGLHKGTSLNWHWLLALEDFYKDGERDYVKWGNTIDYNCGYYRNGFFYRNNCASNFRAVCFDVTKQGLQQYVLSSTGMKWSAAREYCKTHHTGLASVRNEKESQILQDLVGNQKVWTGLFRDPWTWSDGSNSSFRSWPPNAVLSTNINVRHCVTVRDDGEWGKHGCTEKLRFLCSYKITYKQVYKVKFSVEDSGLDLNDPKVTEDILNHIKQQLNGTGVEGVQWKTQPDGKVFRKEEPKKQGGSSICRP